MKKAIQTLQKIQIVIAAIFLGIFLITVVFQIIARYAGIVAMWTEDVSMYSFIWSVFMGAAAMVYEKRHFAFTSLEDAIKNQKVKTIIQLVIACCTLVFTVLMFVYGIQVTKQFWNYTWNTIPSFKRGPVWACLPISGLTASIYLVGQIVEYIQKLVKGE